MIIHQEKHTNHQLFIFILGILHMYNDPWVLLQDKARTHIWRQTHFHHPLKQNHINDYSIFRPKYQGTYHSIHLPIHNLELLLFLPFHSQEWYNLQCSSNMNCNCGSSHISIGMGLRCSLCHYRQYHSKKYLALFHSKL